MDLYVRAEGVPGGIGGHVAQDRPDQGSGGGDDSAAGEGEGDCAAGEDFCRQARGRGPVLHSCCHYELRGMSESGHFTPVNFISHLFSSCSISLGK